MILEGLVTTVSPGGAVHIAPMGPRVEGELDHFVLRPFPTAVTYHNLKVHGEGVFHVTDDVLLLARAALGALDPAPPLLPAKHVRGFILATACRFYEFRVCSVDERGERMTLAAEVVHSGRLRDFFGFNRAKHAVVEAAILATRTAFLPLEEIEAEYRKLAVLVEKTGGAAEREAFAFLEGHLAHCRAARRPPAGAERGALS
jgi:hypothetical protein